MAAEDFTTTSRRTTIIKAPHRASTGIERSHFEDMMKYTHVTTEGGHKISITATGYLQKKSKGGKGKWLKRWWELRGPFLMYWHTEKKAKTKTEDEVTMPAGAIDLRLITAARLSTGEIILKSGNSEYRFKPLVKEEEGEWLRAMQVAIDAAREDDGGFFGIPADHQVASDESEMVDGLVPDDEEDEAEEDDGADEAPRGRSNSKFNLPPQSSAAAAPFSADADAPFKKRYAAEPANRTCVLALGASGFVGVATLEALHKKQGINVPIWVGVRDPENPRLDPLRRMKPKMDLVEVDLSNKDSVSHMIRPGSVVFLVPPGSIGEGTAACDAIDVAVQNRASHLVCLSVLAPEKDPEEARQRAEAAAAAGEEVASFGGQFEAMERRLRYWQSRSEMTYTILRVAMFMDNWMAQPMRTERKIYAPLDPDAKFSIICAKDVGEACANVLAEPEKYVDKELNLAGLQVSFAEVVDQMSEVLGQRVEYKKQTFPECKQFMLNRKMPEWAADGSIDVYKGQQSGDKNMVMPDPGEDDVGDAVFDNKMVNHTVALLGHAPTEPKEWGSKVFVDVSSDRAGSGGGGGSASGEAGSSRKTLKPKGPLKKEGNMKKAGHVNTSMKTRFFRLSKGDDGCYVLKYYGKEEDTKEKGTITMKTAKITELQKANRFSITETKGSGKTYTMECRDEQNLQEWTTILKEATG